MKRGEKRGQSAAGVAILLAIITGMIIFFIIALPPSERAELLGEDSSSSDDDDRDSRLDDDDTEIEDRIVDELYIEENPGRIDYLSQREVEHPLPSVNLFTSIESEVLAQQSSAYAKRGAFSAEDATFSFSIANLERTSDLLLSFQVREGAGDLIILLNDQQIYRSDVATGGDVVALSDNLLSTNNVVEFRVSSPGAAFWRTHEAVLEDIQVVGNVENIDGQSSRHVFLVSETEKNNLEKVLLRFQPECVYDQVGRLSIAINGQEVYDAIPDCALAVVPIEIAPEVLNQGENTITFSTSQGTYLLSHVTLESQLEKIEFPTYYFEPSRDEFDAIVDDDRWLRVELNFVDGSVRKYGEIVINGVTRSFDTKEKSIAFDLSEDVVRGTNSIKIKPRKTLEVRELRVELVK